MAGDKHGLAALALFFFGGATASSQPVKGCCDLRVEVRDAAQQPVISATVEVSGPGRTISDRTDSNGNAHVILQRPGTYSVSVSKDRYIGISHGLDVVIGDTRILEFTLQRHIIETQSVTIAAGDTGVAVHDSVSRTDVKAAPERPSILREALPLMPGVVRTPEGKLVISDTAEHRNSLLVDSLDATDPATGSFGVTVPVDSVVAFDVYKSPFLAEFGRFTSGVVVVETRGGGDSWHWEMNDPTPEFRILGGHLRGIRGWTPRLSFNGPVSRGHVYFSESVEYTFKRTPVRTLAFPHNEEKRESWNSLSRLDWVASSSQLVTLKVHAAPQRLMFSGLGFYNPQPVTPNLWGSEGMADVSHRISLPGGMLQSALSVSQITARVAGQGEAGLIMAPTENAGNYFMRQERRARKLEWVENWTTRPAGSRWKHYFKAGYSVLSARAKGNFQAQPISIFGTGQQVLESIQFENRPGYWTGDLETGVYAHDHWVLNSTVSLDAGLRFERQSVTGVSSLAPRVGAAWSPFLHSATTLRAGAGWFYDRVPLNVFGFTSYPERTITSYADDGSTIGVPATYVNEIDTVLSGRSPLIFGSSRPGNFAPRNLVWDVQLEQTISDVVSLRAEFRQGRARELIVLNPVEKTLRLESGGRSRSQHFELVSRFSFKGNRRLFSSYVYGQTQSNLNEFSEFIGNYPAPLVRPDVYTTASTNIPHRFLAWGVVPVTQGLRKTTGKPRSPAYWQLSRGWLVAPVSEYRTGFPIAPLDERQDYAGIPNSMRFPNFFSLDLRIAKNFAAGNDHAVQISFSAFNLTNHWNPQAVRWSIADPQFGEFLGQSPRRFRVDFDMLF